MGTHDMLMLMKIAVENNDTSEKTLTQIKDFLKLDAKLSVVKLPIRKLAMATLELLGVEFYSSDEELRYAKEILKFERN